MTFSEIKEALNSTVENKEQGVSDKHSLKEYKNLNLFELIYCFLIRKSDPFYYIKFPERRGNSWFSEQLLKLRRIQTKEDTIILPEKFIFIPFQVHDDTQILLNSKNFKSMETFFEFAYSLIKKNFGNEFKVIVKEHPEDLCRYSYKNLYKKYPDVIWLKKFNVDELLDKASYVFVINSSVGLQAIQKFKPTLVCGDSFYSRDEIAFCIKDMNDVDSVVNELKNNLSEDKKKNIEIFMKFLKEKYFVSASWKHITSDGIQKSTLKILEQ